MKLGWKQRRLLAKGLSDKGVSTKDFGTLYKDKPEHEVEKLEFVGFIKKDESEKGVYRTTNIGRDYLRYFKQNG